MLLQTHCQHNKLIATKGQELLNPRQRLCRDGRKTECYRGEKKSNIPEHLNHQQRHCHTPKIRKERQGAEVNQPTVLLIILRIRLCLHKQRNNWDVKQNR
jgi:hypothetical protein